MARFKTRKNGENGRIQSITRRTERACKYRAAKRVTTAGRAR